MIRALINFCNLSPGSLILDFFMGSGTTLVEATLLNYNSIGILGVSLDRLLLQNQKYFNMNYYEKYFRLGFKEILNLDIKELFYLFLYLCSLIDKFKFSTNIKAAFQRNFNKKVRVLKAFGELKKKDSLNFGKSNVIFGNNLKILKRFRDNSIDCIITSPPYLDLIDYIQEDITPISKLFKKNSINKLKENSIGHKQRDYFSLMNKIFNETYRILKANSQFIVVIGDYKNLREKYIEIAKNNNFHINRILLKESISYKKKKNCEYVFFLEK